MKGHVLKSCGINGHTHCTNCGRLLDPASTVWLEWDTHLGGPSKEPILPERSQGFFAYGIDCAKAVFA